MISVNAVQEWKSNRISIMLCYLANLKNPTGELYMNGTRCTEKLHIWYFSVLFLESPSRAESYFPEIKSKTGIKYDNSLWFFHSRNVQDYTFEWEKTSRILHVNSTSYVYLEKKTKHWVGTMQLWCPFIRKCFATALLPNCLGNHSFCFERSMMPNNQAAFCPSAVVS